ncbi:5597_t:CDS:10 [Entrophospora sp. SA101]|nr:5597_t:CDS:10 [Entrophospora sp. SA101]
MIYSLDSKTIRTISSGQVITKVEDVVKELIENSIDAQATSIEVKIVEDGLNLITVKDDGIGIPQDDRKSMALRYHTSKLENYDALSKVETYGFRGETLNSICAISESVEIITKTGKDPVAILYTLDKTGNIISSKSSGLSPGTTINVNKLFSNIPVRRQALKNNSTVIGKHIQNILTTYALVHPSIRFCLKQSYENVAKSKFKDGNWIKPSLETAMASIGQIYGHELMNQLQYVLWDSQKDKHYNKSNLTKQDENYNNSNDDDKSDNSDNEEDRLPIVIEAILPKIDAKPSMVMKAGRTFIYVNNRPITTAKGEIKNVFHIVKKMYNEILTIHGHNNNVNNKKSPFMWINVKMPTWIYDVNVEPSKNLLLFHHNGCVERAIENVMIKLYGINSAKIIEQQLQQIMEVDDLLSTSSSNISIDESFTDMNSTSTSNENSDPDNNHDNIESIQTTEIGKRKISSSETIPDDDNEETSSTIDPGTDDRCDLNGFLEVSAIMNKINNDSNDDNNLYKTSIANTTNVENNDDNGNVLLIKENSRGGSGGSDIRKANENINTGLSLSSLNKMEDGLWTITRKLNDKVIDLLIVHGERLLESDKIISCLKYLKHQQIPDESGVGVWWNLVTQKCVTANGIKFRWREDHENNMHIQITHISPLIQFATAVEYFTHLMEHLSTLNIDIDTTNTATNTMALSNTRSQQTIQILVREAKQLIKQEDLVISKRDEEMTQRVKDATLLLMKKIGNFHHIYDDDEGSDHYIDEGSLAIVERRNDDSEIMYNGNVVVKVLWKVVD